MSVLSTTRYNQRIFHCSKQKEIHKHDNDIDVDDDDVKERKKRFFFNGRAINTVGVVKGRPFGELF